MEEQFNNSNPPVNPRRKKRSKMQIFKETYLPVIIGGVAIILIIIFIIGSITRGVQKNKAEKEANIAASSAAAEEAERLQLEANNRIADAEQLAAGFDYADAIDVLNGFSGDISKFPAINDKILEYEEAMRNLVAWEDPSKIPNFSFQLLVADPARGFSHGTYGYSINRNFITTEEFSKILRQLYDNGYILVDFDDIIETTTTKDSETVYKAKTLMLPNGKKPIMLTQTNVNYNYYLIDGNGDKIPDEKGTGIASKLIWDGSNFINEMVDASGQTVTGNFDLVPILEDFIQKHPAFSYRGARATLALTGYNGLFGYRTHPSAKETFGETEYQSSIQTAKTVAKALQDRGYRLACYTYENIPYGTSSLTQIKSDLNAWVNEVVPIIGNLDILTYAQLTDITSDPTYSGEKYDTLYDVGFRYYLGFCEDGQPWATITNGYVRQGRLMVTGSNLAHHADWFTNYFDASSVLDSTRGSIPN
ncbi:MAG: hypothetical protein IKK11_05095 [Oscillospiraceae bacterium]|nr:hypothetical protein [Oscillospiraceae bacterium]